MKQTFYENWSTQDTSGLAGMAKHSIRFVPPDILMEIGRVVSGSLKVEIENKIYSIFLSLFPQATILRIEKLSINSYISPASFSQTSYSIVLKVQMGSLDPVVVKVAPAKKIELEVEHYDRFIKNKLSRSLISTLERHTIQGEIGGVVYSYIGGPDVKTFSEFYKGHPIEDIQECLNTFFTISWGEHYKRGRYQKNISLFDLYNKVWGNWFEKRVKSFPEAISLQNRKTYETLGLPDPIVWLRENIVESNLNDKSRVDVTRTAITHGDLHAENLLVGRRNIAGVIDFDRCGEGHALQDFIELESDILTRLAFDPQDFRSLYQLAIVVAKQTHIKELSEDELKTRDGGLRKALQTISALRALALKCTGIGDARQYVLGLLFNMIFRATISVDVTARMNQTHTLVLAGIFCKRLEHWSKPGALAVVENRIAGL